jgi:lysophospholipase L1-like esterase
MVLFVIVSAVILFVIVQALFIKLNGTPVARPNISRRPQTIGSGDPLSFVVLGDSTAVSQGGDYTQGYATKAAGHLAQTHRVTWVNLAVPGARAGDVEKKQVPGAVSFRPDVVLIAVGANDVTHFTDIARVERSLIHSIEALKRQNGDVHIVLTGAPDMGSVPRFPQPARWYAGVRTAEINKVIKALTEEHGGAFAPIAERTGQYFRNNPKTAFAADKFHPSTEGYNQWAPVIIEALESRQHNH